MVVIMALASTRPIVTFAERALHAVARRGGGTPAAWWFAILTIGPLLGSFITEPAAMTICALLLARQFYDLGPSTRLKYATIGLLFVNVSIGGTLTHFAAPPVLMVARPWGWDTAFMIGALRLARRHARSSISTSCYYVLFRREFAVAVSAPSATDVEVPDEETRRARPLLPVPAWLTVVHMAVHGLDGAHVALPGAVHRRFPVLPGLRRRPRCIRAAST